MPAHLLLVVLLVYVADDVSVELMKKCQSGCRHSGSQCLDHPTGKSQKNNWGGDQGVQDPTAKFRSDACCCLGADDPLQQTVPGPGSQMSNLLHMQVFSSAAT